VGGGCLDLALRQDEPQDKEKADLIVQRKPYYEAAAPNRIQGRCFNTVNCELS